MCPETKVPRTISGTIFFVLVVAILAIVFIILSPSDLYLLVWLLIIFGACSVFWCMSAPRARIEDYSEA